MPGRLAWEGDTRGPDLLVAESEPDNDGSTGGPDRDQGGSARCLGVSYSGHVGGCDRVKVLGLGRSAGQVNQHGQAAAG